MSVPPRFDREMFAVIFLVSIPAFALCGLWYTIGHADGRASVPLCGIERDTVYIARQYIMVYPHDTTPEMRKARTENRR